RHSAKRSCETSSTAISTQPRVCDSYEAILDACCGAWNALIAQSEVIASIGTKDWAQVEI
ncbi:MAG TPA: hypothetical protein VGP28_04045, partial [Methylocella sp.]|nr:hypothetical protein [Methylocella sp.]